jgi:hypothetical protein
MGLTQMGTQMQQFQTQAMLNALGLRPFENVSTVTPGEQGLIPGMLQSMMDPMGRSIGAYAGAAAGKSMFGGEGGNWSGTNDPGSIGTQGGQLAGGGGGDIMKMLPMLLSMFAG